MANKLYTEEQVRQAMQESRYAFSTKKGYDEILDSLTPIELPSDDEIEEALFHQSNEYAIGFHDAFNFLKINYPKTNNND